MAKERRFKKVDMVLTIEIPVWTELYEPRKEIRHIRDTIVDAVSEHLAEHLESLLVYDSDIATGLAVGMGEDSCKTEKVVLMVDGQKMKINLKPKKG